MGDVRKGLSGLKLLEPFTLFHACLSKYATDIPFIFVRLVRADTEECIFFLNAGEARGWTMITCY